MMRDLLAESITEALTSGEKRVKVKSEPVPGYVERHLIGMSAHLWSLSVWVVLMFAIGGILK